MTGKELIIYILENNLENEEVFKDNKIVGLMTVPEAAVKFEVGTDTVLVWYSLGFIKGISIGDEIYIFANTVFKRPNRKE